MATYIFTDVHGCIDELRELWDLASPSRDDLIIVAGDLVDRGPDSPGVVKFFRELSLNYRVVVIRGNHEDKHERYRKNLVERPGVARDMARNRPELASITQGLSQEDIAFLDGGLLAFCVPGVTYRGNPLTVLHGGVTPTMRHLPKDTSHGSKYDRQVMYVRQIDPSGNMIRLGDRHPGSRFWADIYDGRFGHIVFGHEPFSDLNAPVQYQYATGLDLGCVFGGHLACLKINNDGSDSFLTVKAKKRYASRLGAEDL
jgi:hypothetical protein